MDSRSRWFVGSSSSSASGPPNSAWASSTRTFWPPCSSLIFRSCSALGNIQSVEQNRGVALRRIAVVLRDNAFQFAEPHAVFIGHVGFGVELVAFRERLPERACCP